MKKKIIYLPLFILFLLFITGCSTILENQETASKPNFGTVSQEESPQSDSIMDPSATAPVTDKLVDNTYGNLIVHFIDVGQGASQLLIGPTGKTMLIDAGNNNMEARMVEYLKSQNISKIDILIGTHPDADHIGGLDAVIDNFDIGKIYMPKIQSNTQTFESVLHAIQNKGLKVTSAQYGLVLDWEPNIEVRMVAPIDTYDDTNEMSAVVHVTYGENSFLFTGDAEGKSETDMMASGMDLSANVLLVGHHGSTSSTSEAFLHYVHPTYAVIQVGDNNYGHPAHKVLQRLEDNGINVYRNDIDGNIIFTSNGDDLTVSFTPGLKTVGTIVDKQSSGDQKAAEDTKPSDSSAKEDIDDINATASIDQPTPKQNSTVTVTVHVHDSKGNPVANAHVTLTLHYKSTETVYDGTTNEQGIAEIPFKIGRAAKGFEVIGDITIEYQNLKSTANISFIPQ